MARDPLATFTLYEDIFMIYKCIISGDLMKNCAAFLVSLFLIPASFAHTVECSTSRGDLQLSEWSKSGGAAPAPGILLSTTKWMYKNAVVYEKNVYQEGRIEEKNDSNISWSFNPEGQVYLVNFSTGYSTHAVFATLIDLKSKDGEIMTGMEVTKLTDWFLCQEDDQMYP
jgi:hypothetical protein